MRADDGIQLQAPLWWVAYIAPVKARPGGLSGWWWKTSAVLDDALIGLHKGYADTPKEAVRNVRGALMYDRLYDYAIPDDTKATKMIEHLKPKKIHVKS